MYNQEKQDRFSIITTLSSVAFSSKNHKKNVEGIIHFDSETCDGSSFDIIFLILMHRENKQESGAGPEEQNRS